jgi:hypothetical protein
MRDNGLEQYSAFKVNFFLIYRGVMCCFTLLDDVFFKNEKLTIVLLRREQFVRKYLKEDSEEFVLENFYGHTIVVEEEKGV